MWGCQLSLGGAKYPRIFEMGVQDILGCQISCDTGPGWCGARGTSSEIEKYEVSIP